MAAQNSRHSGNMNKKIRNNSWTQKPNFPPICPGNADACSGPECRAATQFSWLNIFVSSSFDKSYKCRSVICQELKKHMLSPVTVSENELRAEPLSTEICREICKCAHAIVDFANPDSKVPPGGVLAENGVIGCTIRNILNVVDHSTTDLPAAIRSVRYSRYADNKELRHFVRTWVEMEILWPLTLVKTILLPRNKFKTKIIFHCRHETADPSKHPPLADEIYPRLSGGGSGAATLESFFKSFRRSHVLQDSVCTDKKRCPLESVFSKRAEENLKNVNLLLLDAPFSSTGRLNWLLDALLAAERNTPHTLSGVDAAFALLNRKEHKLYKGEEGKKLVYGRRAFYANRAFDYGLVMRIPNPYTPEAFALVMAGLHSPATHAAAQIMSDPYQLSRLAIKLGVSRGEIPENLFFEGVFRVNRTFRPELLGQPEWLVVRRLILKNQ